MGALCPGGRAVSSLQGVGPEAAAVPQDPASPPPAAALPPPRPGVSLRKPANAPREGWMPPVYTLHDPEVPLIRLPRGGVVVECLSQPVQFGIPPETIKDSLKLGLPVPQTFVIPGEMFDRDLGVSVAEFEFPAYFNYFVLQRRVNLVVHPSLVDRIRAIFQETLLGPARRDWRLDEDYAASAPADVRADFLAEGEALDGARATMTADALLNFVVFTNRRATVGDITIEIAGDSFRVMEADCYVTSVPTSYQAPERPLVKWQTSWEPFGIPEFGVTVLGCSHGFDPEGTTTGFVLWLNGRGIMVDPPPGHVRALEEHGIAPQLIEGVIVTHCHADHDAGTFQKILREQSVRLYTTSTIYHSFMRKYSAISGFEPAFLKSTFEFCPVQIGVPLLLRGAELEFFYSLHTIPTVGFEARYRGRSLVYSADTNSNPALPRQLLADGRIGKGRCEALLRSPLTGDHDVILHEAGVPPIHTAIATLAAQDVGVQARLYVVHRSQIPPHLPVLEEWDTIELSPAAPAGAAGTATVAPAPTPAAADDLGITHLFTGVDVFRTVKVTPELEALLRSSARQAFEPGQTILAADEPARTCFLLTAGVAREVAAGWQRKHRVGDLVGERALLRGGATVEPPATRWAVVAETRVHALALEAERLVPFLSGSRALKRLRELDAAQATRTWGALCHNHVFARLSNGQKKQLQALLADATTLAPGETVWEFDCEAREALLVLSGTVRCCFDLLSGSRPAADSAAGSPDEGAAAAVTSFRGNNLLQSFIADLSFGSFIGDVNALLRGGQISKLRVDAVDAAEIVIISRQHLQTFLNDNPGLMLQLLDTQAVTPDRRLPNPANPLLSL